MFKKINSVLSVISRSIASNSRRRPTTCNYVFYGGLSRFLSSVNDVGGVTQCKDIVHDSGSVLSRLWVKQ